MGPSVTFLRLMQRFLVFFTVCYANDNAKRLYDDLLRDSGYNKLVRPVGNNTDKLIVRLGIRLSQLIDIDEKNQIMTTNVWLRQEWFDRKLTWKPAEYGGVDRLYVPSEHIWLPDIVLYNNFQKTSVTKEWRDMNLRWDPKEYGGIKTFEIPSEDIWNPEIVLFNNADGNYQVTLMTKATLHPDGLVVWEPPAIYKSSCIINVEFFPFDVQNCSMKFGSWTYDGDQVDLVHICEPNAQPNVVIEKGMDLRGFYPSVEWDILQVTAKKATRSYPCCPELYPDITFSVTMRRKTLFHTVNLIIPCVSISFLTVLVFYLPSDSGEKVTLCISILLSLTVFFLLLAEIIPPTSIVVPLIGKYLLFTMILVVLSIIVTVVVLNVHFRSPATHNMSPWVRRVFLNILPRLLVMRRPYPEEPEAERPKNISVRSCNGIETRPSLQHEQEDSNTSPLIGCPYSPPVPVSTSQRDVPPRCHPRLKRSEEVQTSIDSRHSGPPTPIPNRRIYSREILDAIDSVHFIADHLKREEKDHSLPTIWRRRFPVVMEDWKYVAMVLDRLFLWIFTTACLVGTFGIILQAPTLYDSRQSLTPINPTDGCYSSYTSSSS